MAAPLKSVREIERAVTALRNDPGSDLPYQRTSVATHTAWVPLEWVEAVEDVLSHLGDRHPSRTIVLFPQPAEEDGLEGEVDIDVFPVGGGRQICTETIRIRLNGPRASAPASVVQPLLLPDLPADYEGLTKVFDRVVVSDIAWARTSRWRPQLASLWPGIADVSRIRVTGTAAQAHLLAGWLRARLDREIELEHEPADRLEGVAIDGEAAPFPPGDPPAPADLLSEELDRFDRDRIYEEAVRGALK